MKVICNSILPRGHLLSTETMECNSTSSSIPILNHMRKMWDFHLRFQLLIQQSLMSTEAHAKALLRAGDKGLARSVVRRRTDRGPQSPRYIPNLGSHTSGMGGAAGSESLSKIISLLRICDLGNTAFHFVTYYNTKMSHIGTSWYMRQSAV